MDDDMTYTISEAANLLSVHQDTLKRWEREGLINPDREQVGLRQAGDRIYTLKQLQELQFHLTHKKHGKSRKN